ncbi:MAG: pyridoxamine 5'-phosphate oxidase family protein [Leptolyngbyaceae cyanobacterium MAG.088]|nr:pyridoxamine 5'-phosphate oxidase family protein [Leptolyngbyaceae cyanobacterium MAG.088]
MKTERTRVKRVPKRGHYDLETVYSILDAGLICHVGFAMEGQPFVIPTAYGRLDNRLFIHGSPASRMLTSLQQGIDVCVTVTLLDGLVLARSAMHHSMNYRSVVLFGTAELVSEREEKMQALYAFTEHVMLGRWAETREPNEQELTGTTVLALPIDEASAKIRTGPPIDDAADYELPHWAGVIPLAVQPGEPIVDPKLAEGIAVPEHVEQYLGRQREVVGVV